MASAKDQYKGEMSVTTIKTYRNKRNPNKYLEVHNDGHYHNSLKQYMFWSKNPDGAVLSNPIKNVTGDRKLHRWSNNHRNESKEAINTSTRRLKKRL